MAKHRPRYNWASLAGSFEFGSDPIRFEGGTIKYGEEPGPALGMAICDQWFGGGSLSADIQFSEPTSRASCQLVLSYNPTTRAFLSAGLGNEALYGIVSWDTTRWNPYSIAGDPNRLIPKQYYHIETRVRGSLVNLLVDGIEVASATLPMPMSRSQVGVWCRDQSAILIKDFTVSTEPPRAFIVMQFSSPYNELYQEVVKPICTEFHVDAARADEGLMTHMVLG